MLAALVVNEVTSDIEENTRAMEQAVIEAAGCGVKLVLFPEAASTGLINNDDPRHDAPFFQTVPGPLTSSLARLVRQLSVYVGFGLLEKCESHYYDSAALLSPAGDIALHYHRMNPNWHGPRVDKAVYGEGTGAMAANTPFGRIAFLIYGDLFDDRAVESVRLLDPDFVLLPMARCFEDGSYDQERWENEELPAYARRAAGTGATVLMVNYLAHRELMGGSFGGATVFAPSGEVITSLPLGRPGVLYVEV